MAEYVCFSTNFFYSDKNQKYPCEEVSTSRKCVMLDLVLNSDMTRYFGHIAANLLPVFVLISIGMNSKTCNILGGLDLEI